LQTFHPLRIQVCKFLATLLYITQESDHLPYSTTIVVRNPYSQMNLILGLQKDKNQRWLELSLNASTEAIIKGGYLTGDILGLWIIRIRPRTPTSNTIPMITSHIRLSDFVRSSFSFLRRCSSARSAASLMSCCFLT